MGGIKPSEKCASIKKGRRKYFVRAECKVLAAEVNVAHTHIHTNIFAEVVVVECAVESQQAPKMCTSSCCFWIISWLLCTN